MKKLIIALALFACGCDQCIECANKKRRFKVEVRDYSSSGTLFCDSLVMHSEKSITIYVDGIKTPMYIDNIVISTTNP